MGNVQARLAAGLLFVVALVLGVQTLHAPKTPSPVTPGASSNIPIKSTILPPAKTTPAPSQPDPISDAEAASFMSAYVPGANQQAIERILAAHDRRFVPVLIELLHGIELGMVHYLSASNVVPPLEALSGQALGGNWRAWMEWYGTTDLAPPAGFTGWKGQLLGRIDAGFAQFLRDDVPARIRSEEIVWGGVRVDGIPALDQPRTLTAEGATYLEPGDVVFGLVVNGEARAYPLERLVNQRVVNDTVGEKNVVLVTTAGLLELAGQSVRAGAVRYSAGAEVRAYERSGETFRAGPDEHSLFDEAGRPWQLGEGTLVGPTDQSYPRLAGHLAYWFGWFAFFPHTLVYSR